MSQLEFDRRLVERLERLYATRDVQRRRGLVRAALGARGGDRVLDVGCGPGFYVTELLEAVGPDGSVVGVDVSGDMLAVAAKRAEGHDNVEFHEADATSLPVPDATFDRALAFKSSSTSATSRRRCGDAPSAPPGWPGAGVGRRLGHRVLARDRSAS